MNTPLQHFLAYLGGITGLLVASLAAIAVITRASSRPRKYAALERRTAALQEELEVLRQENALLRGTGNRPPDLGSVAMEIQEHFASLGAAATDAGDEVWSSLVELSVLRETISGVCHHLQTALHHVLVQLATGIPVREQSKDVQPLRLQDVSSTFAATPGPTDHAGDGASSVTVIRLPEVPGDSDVERNLGANLWKRAGVVP